MRAASAATWALGLLAAALSAHAHRLDEYLQATTISLEKDRVQVDVRLIPGVMVWPKVLARIDTDKDGVLSDAEIRSYAERMQRDLVLVVNGTPLRLRVMSSASDEAAMFRRGLGEIHFQFVVDVPPTGAQRRLVFENKHERDIASYLVNCLVPADTDIRITGQDRNHQQSWYQLDYLQVRSGSGSSSTAADR